MSGINNDDFDGVLKHSGIRKGIQNDDNFDFNRPLLSGFEIENDNSKPPADEIKPVQKKGFFERLKDRFTAAFTTPEDVEKQRIIYLDGKVYPPNSIKNFIRNQKYSMFTFLPSVLYEQFRYFFNLIFLLITLSQFIPVLKVGFLFTYLAPLLFVLVLTLLKEAYDDIQRYKRDKEANSQIYTHVTKEGTKPIPSSDLKVGDIIEITANQRIPADCILLHSSEPSVFIRTDQLDGETDWKLRRPIRITQNYGNDHPNLSVLNASITAEAPRLNIYDFKGLFKLEEGGGEGLREALNLENTLWQNTVLAAGHIAALVIYTGKECRAQMNSRDPRTKIGVLDVELNYLAKILLIIMCSLAFIIVLTSGMSSQWFLQFFRHLLLLSSIIPISLRVNLDFAKLYFSYGINNDQEIPGAIARSSNLPEELGRISYILSDKTGTLTQNSMVMKRLSLERAMFTEESVGKLKKILKKQCLTQYPICQYRKRNLVRDLMTSLILCHNVTPVFDDDGKRSFQASSPDEIALVEFAERVGMKLVKRTNEEILITTAANLEENYKILYEFPFSSERKRMGIVLQFQTSNYLFYLKGADSIMKSKVPEVQRGFLQDECESISREGLRTLVVAQKFMTQKQYEEFQNAYEDAKNSMEDRDEKCNATIEKYLEKDMELVGITGVEDKLQEDIYQTIEKLRNAGISIWMLTGDKIETAQCIAISTGLKSAAQEMFVIREISDPLTFQNELNNFTLLSNPVLVIDGQTLQIALETDNFFQVACNATAVVCCRCSPTQKATVTEKIKAYTKKIVLSIGDGGNDVAMIQAADIGVGIVGKEGKQAALASDFSILKFKDVATLLLWHGRLSYTRTSIMSQFVMHRGLIISIIQMIFSLIFYSVAIPVYNGWLMLGYSTIYTMLPVFCLIFDEDVTRDKALEYADLYKVLLKGRELTDKTFFIWLWKSIYQGVIIMTLSFTFFKNTFIDLVTVTFTSLILAELLNVYSELHKIRLITFLAQLLTFLTYGASMVFFQNYINTSSITVDFIINVVILVLISWLPLHIAKLLLAHYDPSASDKVMKKIKIRK